MDQLEGRAAAQTPRPRPVRARHAASVLVVRPGPCVLMGLRAAGHRFMPNRLVFPGGAVDPEDHTAPVASELTPATRRLLERSANPALARALAIAAARELDEETGLNIGHPPALDRLEFLCRAVTPPALPIRFNARFFVIEAEHVEGTLAGSGELEELRWYTIADTRTYNLAWVTAGVLECLEAFLAAPSAERDARARTPLTRAIRWTTE